MTFKAHRVIVKFELDFVKNFLQPIEQNIADTPITISLPCKPQDLDEGNGLLYDFYHALTNIINHSLEFKQARAKHLKIDTLAFIEKLDVLCFDMIFKLNLLINSKNEELLEYFLKKTISRQSVYYIILINIYHQNKWGFEDYLTGLLNLLVHTTSDSQELEVLMFLKFLVTRNYKSIEDSSENFWIKLILLQALENDPTQLTKLISTIQSHPKFSASVPKLVQQFLSFIFIQGGLYGLSKDSVNNYQHVDLFIRQLINHGILDTSLKKESLLDILAGFNSEFAIFTDNHQLFNGRSQLLSIKYHQLLILQLGVFEHLQPDDLTVDEAFSMAELAIELINANLVPTDEVNARIFWKNIARVFLLPQSVNVNFLYHYISLLPLMVEKMLSQDNYETARLLIEKLLSFNQVSKKNLLLERRAPLLELSALFNFLDKPDSSKPSLEQLQAWFAQASDKKHVIKCLTLEFMDSYYANCKEFLLEKLFTKLAYFKDVLPEYFFTDVCCSLQAYVFSIAKILGPSEAQNDLLEKSFGYEKDFSFELLDDEVLEDKSSIALEKKKQTQSIVEQSIFKPMANVILASQIPDVLIELAAKINAYFPKDGLLVLSGGAVCNLKEDKIHLGDYDCMIELDEDKSLNEHDLLLDGDLKHLNLEHHNQLIQFIIFLKKASYHQFAIRPELGLVELNLPTHNKTISIDIKIEKKSGLNLEQALIRDLAKRDFKLSTLFICLQPGQTEFEIRGFDKAIRSTNKKLISAVGNNPNIFVEDPIRLLRLIKYRFEHQDFNIDSQLSHIYRQTPWIQCFQSLLQTSGGRGRLITHLQQLFSRYGFIMVLDELIKQNKIEALFGINNTQVKETIDLLKQSDESDSYTCRLDLFLFFYIHHAITTSNYEKFAENCYRKLLASFPAQHRIYFEYVEHKIYQKPMDGYVAYQPLLKMLDEINKVYEQKPFLRLA